MNDETSLRLQVAATGAALIVSGGIVWDAWGMKATAVALVLLGALLVGGADAQAVFTDATSAPLAVTGGPDSVTVQPGDTAFSLARRAGLSVADLLVRHAKLGVSGNVLDVPADSWRQTPAWGLLFPNFNEQENSLAEASLQRSLGRLPMVLEGLI